MEYLYLHNLAATYYGECPYGDDTYDNVSDNCSADEPQSTGTGAGSQSPTVNSIEGNASPGNPSVGGKIESDSGAKYTYTTPNSESPPWQSVTPTGLAIGTGAILFVIGLALILTLYKRR